LRVGQPDDVVTGGLTYDTSWTAANASRFTAAWQNGAWHLTDIFDVVLDTTGTSQTVNRIDAQAPTQSVGKININSVLRDDGAVLRALLRTFAFLPAAPYTDANVAGRSLSDAEISLLISQIKSYLQTKGPMMDRGEFSQLPFFASTLSSQGTFGGVLPNAVSDRAREEIFRRLVPMVTTRSSSFTVYAVGQTIREDAKGIVPVAESLKATTYRVDPMMRTGSRGEATNYSVTPIYERY
jgi:hypothetical protein